MLSASRSASGFAASTSGRSAAPALPLARVARPVAAGSSRKWGRVAPSRPQGQPASSVVARACEGSNSHAEEQLQLRPEDSLALQSFLEYQAQRRGKGVERKVGLR